MIFVFVLWVSFELLSLTNGQTCSSPDGCRQLEFMPDHSFDGRRLIDHVIQTVDDILEGSCRTLCYMEPDCVSYNFKKAASENEKYKCELNNSTFEGQKRKLKTNSGYIYRGAKNACLKKPCTEKGTCQTGVTDKGYRCLCTAGFRGQHCEKAAKSCQDYFDEDKSIMSQVVTLILDSKPTSVFCHMGDFGCGDGGWTPVMKMDGNKISLF